ncbi:MAG TPA: hypothetical protein DEV93_02990 [Chloroflexi bacterium]|nr:hypothetical protein [Chloroflexota bacterium]
MRQGFTKRRLRSALAFGVVATIGFALYDAVVPRIEPIFIVAGSVGSLVGISLLAYVALGYSGRFT